MLVLIKKCGKKLFLYSSTFKGGGYFAKKLRFRWSFQPKNCQIAKEKLRPTSLPTKTPKDTENIKRAFRHLLGGREVECSFFSVSALSAVFTMK